MEGYDIHSIPWMLIDCMDVTSDKRSVSAIIETIANPNPAFVTESETHSWRDKLTTAHKRSGPSGGLSPRLSFPLLLSLPAAQVQRQREVSLPCNGRPGRYTAPNM